MEQILEDGGCAYHFVVLVAELLAHQLVGPLVGLGGVAGLLAGDDERHIVFVLWNVLVLYRIVIVCLVKNCRLIERFV